MPRKNVNLINQSKSMQQVSARIRFLTPDVLFSRPCFLPASPWSPINAADWLVGWLGGLCAAAPTTRKDCTTLAPAGGLSLFLPHIHDSRIVQRKQSSETRTISAITDSPISSLLLTKRTKGQGGRRLNENGPQHIRDYGTRTESEKVGGIRGSAQPQAMCFH